METLEEVKFNMDYHRRKDNLEPYTLRELLDLLGSDSYQEVKKMIIEYILENNLDKDLE